MKKYLLPWIVLAAFAAAPPAAQAAQVTLAAVRDNTIYGDQPTNSNGRGDNFAAGVAGSVSATRRGLVAFDLTGLPAPIRVDRVALELRFQGTTNQETDPRVVSIYRLLANWGEGTSNSGPGGTPGSGNGTAATTNDATWRSRFFNTQNWAAYNPAVAGSGGGDFAVPSSASTTVGIDPDVLATWETIRSGPPSGMVADVEQWLADPASNAGWLLKSDDESELRTMRRFFSKDAANTAFHPRLVIDYTVVPEPTTLSLWAVGGLGAILTRSKRRGRIK